MASRDKRAEAHRKVIADRQLFEKLGRPRASGRARSTSPPDSENRPALCKETTGRKLLPWEEDELNGDDTIADDRECRPLSEWGRAVTARNLRLPTAGALALVQLDIGSAPDGPSHLDRPKSTALPNPLGSRPLVHLFEFSFEASVPATGKRARRALPQAAGAHIRPRPQFGR